MAIDRLRQETRDRSTKLESLANQSNLALDRKPAPLIGKMDSAKSA